MFNVPEQDPQGGSGRNTAIQKFKELVTRLFQGVHNKVNPSNEHQTQNILKTDAINNLKKVYNNYM